MREGKGSEAYEARIAELEQTTKNLIEEKQLIRKRNEKKGKERKRTRGGEAKRASQSSSRPPKTSLRRSN